MKTRLIAASVSVFVAVLVAAAAGSAGVPRVDDGRLVAGGWWIGHCEPCDGVTWEYCFQGATNMPHMCTGTNKITVCIPYEDPYPYRWCFFNGWPAFCGGEGYCTIVEHSSCD